MMWYFDYLTSECGRERIDYKFQKSGHSYGRVDQASGKAEKILKPKTDIEMPGDFARAVNKGVVNANIEWKELTNQSLFKDYATWFESRYETQNRDVEGNRYSFTDAVWFNFGCGEAVCEEDGIVKTYRHPGKVWIRQTMDPTEPPAIVCYQKPGSRRLDKRNLTRLNREFIRPNAGTFKGLDKLQSLCRPEAQRFYDELFTHFQYTKIKRCNRGRR